MRRMKRVLVAVLAIVMFSLALPAEAPQSFLVTTTQAASSVKISATKKSLYIGEKFTLKVTGTSKKVTWSSSDKSIASVSSKGKVTAKKAGTATITAKVGSKKLTCKITVKKALKTDVTSLKLKDSDKSVTVTFKLQGTLTYNIENTDIVSCKWASSWVGNTVKLTISPKKPGTTKVTITNNQNKEKAVIKVTVLSPVTVKLPTLPQTITEYTYSGNIDSMCDITDIWIETSVSYDGTCFVKAWFTGKKTYDREPNTSSACRVGWKLYDAEGYVVESGTFYSTSVCVGEKFKDYTYLSTKLPKGTYTLKIMDVK